MPLSSVDTLENNPEPTPTDAAQTPDEHEHDHGHEHDHEHAHGPVLNPDCTRELVLDVPAEDVSKSFRRVTREYQKHAKIPGFRPGKVPDAVIKRRFANEIRKEVIDSLLPERFNQAVRDLGVAPVGQPQVTEIDGRRRISAARKSGVRIHSRVFHRGVQGHNRAQAPGGDHRGRSPAGTDAIERIACHHRAGGGGPPLVEGDWAQISYKGVIEAEPEAEPVAGEDTLVEDRRQGYGGGILLRAAWRQGRARR